MNGNYSYRELFRDFMLLASCMYIYVHACHGFVHTELGFQAVLL